MSSRVLLLTAHLPELSGLRAIMGAELRRTYRGYELEARPVGIGAVAAARGAALALRTFEPSAAVFVGTCGAYEGRGVAIGDVVVGLRISLVSTAVAEGRAGFPAPMRTEVESSAPLVEALTHEGHRKVSVATTLAVTTDDALAARVAEHRACDVEHLESFAVAEACAEAGVAFVAVLGVANRVGSTAREEWRQNHRTAGHAAGAVVARWLEQGARGL